jgi:hypothetical protein
MWCQKIDVKSKLNCIGEFFKEISIGKYKSKFYYKGKNSEESIIGGILAAALYIFILIFSIITLVDVIKRKNYFLDLKPQFLSSMDFFAKPKALDTCENCITIKNKDLFPMIFGGLMMKAIETNSSLEMDCSKLWIRIFMVNQKGSWEVAYNINGTRF